MRLAVVGIGQRLRGDDAAGLKAVELWQSNFPDTASRSDLRVQLVEQPGTELLSHLDDVSAAIIVDATRSRATPGTVRLLDEGDLSSTGIDARGAHGWGVAEMLRMHRLLSSQTPEIRVSIVGIEARQADVGAPLSLDVQQSLPQASAAIQRLVLAHLDQ